MGAALPQVVREPPGEEKDERHRIDASAASTSSA